MSLLVPGSWVLAQGPDEMDITGSDINVISGDQAYASYLAAPDGGEPLPRHRADSFLPGP